MDDAPPSTTDGSCARADGAGVSVGLATDADLVRRVLRGDALAFEDLYARHAAGVLGVAQAVVGDRVSAQDVAQDTFLVLWRAAGAYDPERASVRTWLHGIARNRGIDALRRRRTHERRLAAAAEAEGECLARSNAADEAVRRDERAVLLTGLRGLPEAQRRVLVLAYFGGMTTSEVAKLLELPLGTVKSRARLGLKALGAHLAAPVPAPVGGRVVRWPAATSGARATGPAPPAAA